MMEILKLDDLKQIQKYLTCYSKHLTEGASYCIDILALKSTVDEIRNKVDGEIDFIEKLYKENKESIDNLKKEH